jgi:hypothetical protein
MKKEELNPIKALPANKDAVISPLDSVANQPQPEEKEEKKGGFKIAGDILQKIMNRKKGSGKKITIDKKTISYFTREEDLVLNRRNRRRLKKKFATMTRKNNKRGLRKAVKKAVRKNNTTHRKCLRFAAINRENLKKGIKKLDKNSKGGQNAGNKK